MIIVIVVSAIIIVIMREKERLPVFDAAVPREKAGILLVFVGPEH